MIKTLSRKFVFTAMTAISILLILLIGAINVINFISSNKEEWKSLETISRMNEMSAMAPEGIPQKPNEVPGQNPPGQADKNAYDTYMASNFFIVRLSSKLKVKEIDISRTSFVSEDEAVKMADEVMDAGKTKGRTGNYIYILSRNNSMNSGADSKGNGSKDDILNSTQASNGYSIVFLDTGVNKKQVLYVLLVSILVGLAFWIIMLFVTMLLSKRAIRPIAENIERQKRFVTDAGHEYKTPLAIIQSNADAMELYNGENKWLTNIRLQVERLNALTRQMLLLAKMDEGRKPVKKEYLLVSELIDDKLIGFEQEIKQKEISLSCHMEENVTINCNRDDIGTVLGILIDNSVKYVKPGGFVSLNLKKTPKGMRFVIENDCEKLPEVRPEKLFERFYRADMARNQESGGSGIGLSIAQSVTELYGGKISCEYAEENVIRFVVEI